MKRRLPRRAQLVATVLVFAALGTILFFTLTAGPKSFATPPPVALGGRVPGQQSSGSTTTGANLQPSPGDVAVSLPIAPSDPLFPFISPGSHIDILLEGSSVQFVEQDLRVLSITGAAPGGAPAPSPIAPATPNLSTGTIVVEVPVSEEGVVLSVVNANPGKIHFAIVGTPIPTPTPKPS